MRSFVHATRSSEGAPGKRRRVSKRKHNAHHPFSEITFARARAVIRQLVRAGRGVGQFWSSRDSGLRTAALPWRRLYLGAGVLGLRLRLWGLLLGPWYVGIGARSWPPLDARLLGVEWRRIRFLRWILGAARRVL